jgi:hypothetical protein
MIAVYKCSRFHLYIPSQDLRHQEIVYKKRCPMVMSYDRMSGSTYCQRIIKKYDMPEIECWKCQKDLKIMAYSGRKNEYINYRCITCGYMVRYKYEQ